MEKNENSLSSGRLYAESNGNSLSSGRQYVEGSSNSLDLDGKCMEKNGNSLSSDRQYVEGSSNSLDLDRQCLEMARKQFCLDIGLPWDEYVKNSEKSVFIQKSVYVPNTLDIASIGARNYAEKTSFFRAIICLGQLFICCDKSIYDWVKEQYSQCKPEWFCAFGNLRRLEKKLQEHGHRICDTHVYFLPKAVDRREAGENIAGRQNQWERTKVSCEVYEQVPEAESEAAGGSEQQFVWYEQEEILQFKDNNRFTSAVSFWKGHPDVLAVAALKEDCAAESRNLNQRHMAGMAGASLDGEYLWQIGIDVDKECAGQGLGHKLVRALKEEILRRGKVPFYGTSESHIVSQTVGLKAGFVPAWTEVSAEKLKCKS